MDAKLKQDQNFCKELRIYFKEYCSFSSLHGFRYLGGDRTYFERIWWFAVFIITVSGCVYTVLLVYQRWEESPVIVSFATIEKPLHSIPFPAVTVCPETKINLLSKDYKAEAVKLWRHEQMSDKKKQQIYHFVSLICDNEDDKNTDDFWIEERNESTNVLDILNPNDYPHPVIGCRYNGRNLKNCAERFVPILTEEGICYTFNMLNRSEIFQDDVEIPPHFFKSNITTQHWNLSDGYTKDADMFAEPLRALTSGVKNAFVIDLHTAKNQFDTTCKMVQGYRVTLHIPTRLPRPSHEYFRVPLGKAVLGLINPNIIETSPTVESFRPDTRACYFPRDRKLTFFKIYSKHNCDIECLSNFTRIMCNCVDFYMPRHNNTEICGMKKRACVQQAAFFLRILELQTKTQKQSHLQSLLPSLPSCSCMAICNDLTYNVDTSRSAWHWKKKYPDCNGSLDAMSRVMLFFQNTQLVTHSRHELYAWTDFVSNFGGLLGLFTGFSMMSILELFYFLTIRIYFNARLYGQWYGQG